LYTHLVVVVVQIVFFIGALFNLTENSNRTERINLEMMLKHKFDARNTNRIEKQQHETWCIIRTDTITLEMMKKQQSNRTKMIMIKQRHEPQNINRTEMLMKKQQHQTRNIKRKEIMENEKSLAKRFHVCSPSEDHFGINIEDLVEQEVN
jgi:hypothetical protein